MQFKNNLVTYISLICNWTINKYHNFIISTIVTINYSNNGRTDGHKGDKI